jgi:transcriptional regulator with XRE-family HTH domain
MSRESIHNPRSITSFRRAVKLFDTYVDIANAIKLIPDESSENLEYSVLQSVSSTHISKVLNGKARPSYELAVALVHLANANIRKVTSVRFLKKLTDSQRKMLSHNPITCKDFNLRTLPLMHYEGTNKKYFESTPNRWFSRYNVDGIGKSMASIAANVGVSERTLQKWVITPADMPVGRAHSEYPRKIEGATYRMSELVDRIFEQSIDKDVVVIV